MGGYSFIYTLFLVVWLYSSKTMFCYCSICKWYLVADLVLGPCNRARCRTLGVDAVLVLDYMATEHDIPGLFPYGKCLGTLNFAEHDQRTINERHCVNYI